MSGSGISWAICKSAPSSRQITTPAPHRSVFYRPDALPAAQPTASKHRRQTSYLLIRSVAFGDLDGVFARLPEEQFHHRLVVGPQRFKELAHNSSRKLTQLLLTTMHKHGDHCHRYTHYMTLLHTHVLPTNRFTAIIQVNSSVLWRCWLGGRKGIRPVKNWAVGCWRGYLSGVRCRFAYGSADATATHCLLLQ